MTASMQGKTVIVTGANAGIGRVTARELACKGAHVVMVCRSRERGEAALAEIRAAAAASDSGGAAELLLVDMASQDSIRAGAAAFLEKHDRLDVLVNNAGLLLKERRTTPEGLESVFAINHLGYFLFTHLLRGVLERSGAARVVNVASEAHRFGALDLDDVNFERRRYRQMRVYGTTKLMNILFSRELARRLREAGSAVTSNSLHPGTIVSSFAREGNWLIRLFYRVFSLFLKTPEQGARTQLYLASAPEVEGVSGEYFSNCKRARPNRAARDDEAAARLWTLSEQLCGLD